MGRLVANQTMQRNALTSGVDVLENAPEGLYYINLNDDQKTAVLKYIKKGE